MQWKYPTKIEIIQNPGIILCLLWENLFRPVSTDAPPSLSHSFSILIGSQLASPQFNQPLPHTEIQFSGRFGSKNRATPELVVVFAKSDRKAFDVVNKRVQIIFFPLDFCCCGFGGGISKMLPSRGQCYVTGREAVVG